MKKLNKLKKNEKVDIDKQLVKYMGENNIQLSKEKRKEIEEKFEKAGDFSEIGEQITSPINNIVDRTMSMVDNDPIMDVSDELDEINKGVNTLYGDIIQNNSPILKFARAIPLLGLAVDKITLTAKDISFNIKETGEKIEALFSDFDTSYESLLKSIRMQNAFLKGLDNNLDEVMAYRDFINTKLNEFEEKLVQVKEKEQQKYKNFAHTIQYFLDNLDSLIGNLVLARKRVLMRLDSAHKLSLAMSTSRPIFKTLLSTAVLETASQKPIEASIKTMNNMGETIDKINKDLTDKAIKSNKESQKMFSKPVLDTKKFVENVNKLKRHFDDIEEYRKRVEKEASQERKEFKKAKRKLEGFDISSSKNNKELLKHLNQR